MGSGNDSGTANCNYSREPRSRAGGHLRLYRINYDGDLASSCSLLLEALEQQVCSFGKKGATARNSSLFMSNDIMSCQSETKSLNITNGATSP